ncbi:hypothetical protein WOLCODRAFT_164112 [Wolfiporia cocos MD-104 SS10]|uniref:Uncharacterized protein n=1 Tax=Wolfiporia cocos (strain MD-104) TaxID=742152 RepID=A0A2H3JL55_WOLCO|nr:hypothetical protein WOLCODRAFT_164112 [Wolfiporia cocos MD-104 SS10]
MANIHDEAWRGNLTANRLKDYTKLDSSVIDTPGGRKSLTPLAAACYRGHPNIVQLLLNNPYCLPDVDAPSLHNRSPLFYATRYCPPQSRRLIVRALLDAGADVNACSDFADGGYTPLMNAVAYTRDKELIHMLLDHGASPFIKNSNGIDSIQMADECGLQGELLVRGERDAELKQSEVINAIVASVLLIIAYFDSVTVRGVIVGVTRKLSQDCGLLEQADGKHRELKSIKQEQVLPAQNASMYHTCCCHCRTSYTGNNRDAIQHGRTSSMNVDNQGSVNSDSSADAEPESLDASSDLLTPPPQDLVHGLQGMTYRTREPFYKVQETVHTPQDSESICASQDQLHTQYERVNTPDIDVVPHASENTSILLAENDSSDPVAPEDFETSIANNVDNLGLGKFYTNDSPIVQEIARKATLYRQDPTATLTSPEDIKRLTMLSLFRTVILCDDSKSMSWGTPKRWTVMRQVVSRICGIATRIVPDGTSLDVRFINANTPANRICSPDDMERVLGRVTPSNGTQIGRALERKILEPLVYNHLPPNSDAGTLPQPLLICIITDGSPSDNPRSLLKDNIVKCIRTLEQAQYKRGSVVFCVNQIGDDEGAAKFLGELRSQHDIADVLYCSHHRLDVKYEEFKENMALLDKWLLELLTEPIRNIVNS